MQPKPLAVYIHWPFCRSKCPYCDFNSHVRENVEQERWKQALLRELDHMATYVPQRRVTSIFFGGGTPSLMPADTVAALIERVQSRWQVSNDIEITLEANPTSVEAERFRDFRQAGVNRVSLGVQSLDDASLKFLGRGHNAQEALAAIALARDTFERYTFDLIYARPNQTEEAWEQELTKALSYASGHLSLYQLTIEENTAFHHAYKSGDFALPDEAAAEKLYRLTETLMGRHGLQAYEVSNYAAPGQESRHNLAYWKGYDYVGIGPGAHGRLTLDHPQRQRIATQTLKSPERWLENTERNGHALELWDTVERQQETEERLMMGLRLREGFSYEEFVAQAGYDLKPYLNPARMALYVEKGLLADDPLALRATLSGRLLLNTLTAELLN